MKQKKCLEITADLWNKWLEIEDVEKHQDDNNDFRFHVHALQNLLFANMYKNDTILAQSNKDVAIALHNEITEKTNYKPIMTLQEIIDSEIL